MGYWLAVAVVGAMTSWSEAQPAPPWSEGAQVALKVAQPLRFPRGGRLPLYTAPTQDPGLHSDAQAERLVSELDTRGIAVICSWSADAGQRQGSLARALPIARAQHRLGLPVNVNATSCLYSFFDGSPETAHVDAQGKPFFDPSLGRKEMGCPFAIDHRRTVIRERIEYHADAYAAAGLPIGFSWTDWEIDGPLEINRAHEASRRCVRCRANIPGIDDFRTFQRAIRQMRSYLQYDVYARPLRARFPGILVSNYALYPHDGYRYWLDYFESEDYTPAQPYRADQGAKYREWYDDFPGTGFTYAMPVVYTWENIYRWYDFEPSDYRWFYNMLLVATNAGKSTPATVPIIPFVHWHTIVLSDPPPAPVPQMSAWAYQELLWHMLLRGTDTFFVWCGGAESEEEIRLVHEVWAAAQEHGAFLEAGMPACFEVPAQPGTVVSALVLDDRALVRRTDFAGSTEPVEVRLGLRRMPIPALPGQCQVIDLSPAAR
ncbi:MAG: hypothetical protein AB1505_30265 [Candidatus Latescibacterota bacterium]